MPVASTGLDPHAYSPSYAPLTNHAYPAISSLPTNVAALRTALSAAASRDNKSGQTRVVSSWIRAPTATWAMRAL
jgi:hypothetical protein